MRKGLQESAAFTQAQRRGVRSNASYRPKMVYLRSRCGAFAYVMKNCERLVLAPLFAMETIPRALC